MRLQTLVRAVGVLSLTMAATVVAAGDGQESQGAALTYATARLEVDATGKVAVAELIGKKPHPILAERAEAVARAWRFQPVLRDGKPVGGTTYANMHICVVPDGEGMRVAIDFAGNGPDSEWGRRKGSSELPIGSMVGAGIFGLSGKVQYRVGADGRAKLESATLSDPKLQSRYGVSWWRELNNLVKESRFKPEMVDGVPVATRVETVYELRWLKSDDKKAAQAMNSEVIAESNACRSLRENGVKAEVALDSPFKRLTEG